MDLPRSFTIRESSHRIHNPYTPAQLATLGEAIGLRAGTSMLDLCCGSGEMLCTWAVVGLFDDLGYDLVEMVLADEEGWDRYRAAQWFNVRAFLDEHPGDELAAEFREELTRGPRRYVRYERPLLGWGVFALMRR